MRVISKTAVLSFVNIVREFVRHFLRASVGRVD
mgnify:CR=1 FL=1|jgi:hypothetical protein